MKQPIEIGPGGHRWLRGIIPALALLPLVGCASSLPDRSYGSQAVAAQRALEYLPDAESLDWIDPETGLDSRVTVLSTQSDAQGRHCRELEYRPQLTADPVSQSYCRNPATGLWEIEDDRRG